MTEPSAQRPVPGPPRPAPGPQQPAPGSQHPVPGLQQPASSAPAADGPEQVASPEDRFADLARQPVPEHVAAFEAEHARLQRELGTIDQL